jgi:hypothetical protein
MDGHESVFNPPTIFHGIASSEVSVNQAPAMTLIRPLFSWLLRKAWSVVAVFVVLLAGTWVVAKLQELEQLNRTTTQIQRIETGVKEAAERAKSEAQARVQDLDRAAVDAVQGRLEALNAEIKQLSGQMPSAGLRAIAIAKGDLKTISDWAGKEVTILARREERDVLARMLDYRKQLSEYERRWRDGPAELERLRQEHISELEKIERLNQQFKRLATDHPIRIEIPLTWTNAELRRLQDERTAKTAHTHLLKAKHDELSAFLKTIRKPKHPGALLQSLKVEPVLEELRTKRVAREAQLRQDWFWQIINFDLKKTDLLKAALIIVAVAAVIPVGIRLVLFYVLAPIATRRTAVALIPKSDGRVLTVGDLPQQSSAGTSSVSCRVSIDTSNELLVHSEYLQSMPNASDSRTQWILDRHIPLSSIAAGLFAMTHIRAESPQTVVISSTRDPLSEVSLLAIPAASCIVLLPRHIVGVLQPRGTKLRISRHWRVFNLHAWLTLQLRYLVFHGPVTMVVKGCRGVRVEAAEEGRSLSPAATIGFSANLRYSSRRCPTLYAYLSGQQPLLNDSFAGGTGYYIYQEMPYERRRGFFGRGLEGLLDAVLKPMGI